MSCICGSDRVEALHVDEDAAEEPLEDLAERVAHQADEAQLQVVGHFLQDAAGVLLHLVHGQTRLHRNLRENGRNEAGDCMVTGNKTDSVRPAVQTSRAT